MTLNEVAYSDDIIWITYGSDAFDPSRFEAPQPCDSIVNKPLNGLWACPLNSRYGWEAWCREEDFKTARLNSSFTFKLKPDAKIYVIDNLDDLINISTCRYFSVWLIDVNRLLSEGYDGIYATENAIKLRGCYKTPRGTVEGLGCWDVESICVFNPNVIIPLNGKNKNMKKNVIKLNEAQIRKMVAESVKNVLSELDWKTYTNAAKKAHKKFQVLGNKGRSFNNKEYSKRFRQLNGFEDAAVNAFNDEYGYNSNDAAKDRYGMTKNGLSLYVDPEYKGRPISTFMEKGGKGEGKEYAMWPSLDPANAANIHTVKTTFPHDDIVWDDTDSDPQYSPQAVSARDRGNQEIKDYMAGNYKYRKGKGWQLKESQLRNMIAESVKKALIGYFQI